MYKPSAATTHQSRRVLLSAASPEAETFGSRNTQSSTTAILFAHREHHGIRGRQSGPRDTVLRGPISKLRRGEPNGSNHRREQVLRCRPRAMRGVGHALLQFACSSKGRRRVGMATAREFTRLDSSRKTANKARENSDCCQHPSRTIPRIVKCRIPSTSSPPNRSFAQASFATRALPRQFPVRFDPVRRQRIVSSGVPCGMPVQNHDQWLHRVVSKRDERLYAFVTHHPHR